MSAFLLKAVCHLGAIFAWLVSVVLFFMSSARLPEFLYSFYQGLSVKEAFKIVAARPVPVHYVALIFGFVLLCAWLAQLCIYGRRWVSVQFICAKMLVVGVVFLDLLDFVGWYFRCCGPIFLSGVSGLLLFVLFIISGVLGLNLLIVKDMQRLGLVVGKGAWFAAGGIWVGMALLLTVIQVVIIALMRV